MEDCRLTAIGDAPLGFGVQQGANAVVDHRVVRPAPPDRGVAAEQTTDAGIGSHGSPHLVAQQVDHQHIGLGHQGFECWDGLGAQLFIGVQHQHPVAVEKLQGLVAGWGEVPRPGNLLNPGSGRFGDGHRRIGGAGVHHHHLVGEALHGAQALPETRLFIAHDHREAEHGRPAWGWREVKCGWPVRLVGGGQSVNAPLLPVGVALGNSSVSTWRWASCIWPAE